MAQACNWNEGRGTIAQMHRSRSCDKNAANGNPRRRPLVTDEMNREAEGKYRRDEQRDRKENVATGTGFLI